MSEFTPLSGLQYPTLATAFLAFLNDNKEQIIRVFTVAFVITMPAYSLIFKTCRVRVFFFFEPRAGNSKNFTFLWNQKFQ